MKCVTYIGKNTNCPLHASGRYAFHRLPFGISSAPEIFSKAMMRVLAGIPGVICHMDDILVYGKDEESHIAARKAVLTRLQTSGLALNKKMCEFNNSSLTFLGYVIDGVGVKPDSNKVKAIRDLPDPTCKSDLRRLNGMLNQLAKSIPHLATFNVPMREQLETSG